MTDEHRIQQRLAEIAAVADSMPGVVIVLNDDCRRVLYMSARGLAELGTTLAEVTALGEEYYARYFNPDEAHEYVPKVVGLLERNDLSYTVTFFQQVRTGPQGCFELHLSTARVLLQGQQGRPLLTICLSCRIDPDSHITTKVQRLLDENTFLRAHAARFAGLTKRERQVLAGISRGLSSGELAEALFISAQTVDTHRRNLRQKLQTTSAFELGQYARAFDLI
ncbi:transcriptional regulator, LuxR family [Hymenobacter roseosalivarius DSM 11622]|uniref:Transcriptional regulator, LuxR family n=1 Tax=Hymenobacter roseosalivarius DSM 11622 TaxID=645990 RepID=A0A1W1W4G2_9BACT|nr:helix-turn-helix transcriptional regulator [Hymenobacter roseosalivarius]SMB99954.1 transcriptional regulator, LuxR family [Hymenobacter roseosalivarius DSM 11622]